MTMDFVYSQGWYENVYHKGGKDPNKEPDPSQFHPERDLKCLADLGVKPEHKILVCGCGGGDDTWLLTEKLDCHNVWGLDFSRPAVMYFNEHFRDRGKVTGNGVHACCTMMPFDDNTFDMLLAMDITEHLPMFHYMFFLMNCYRILKYGGRVAVLPGRSIRPEHISLIPPQIIAEHMKRVGFHIASQNNDWIIGEKNEAGIYSKP